MHKYDLSLLAYSSLTHLPLSLSPLLLQHHDGVTGTSEPPVVEMYANDLTNGISNALQVLPSFFRSFAPSLLSFISHIYSLFNFNNLGKCPFSKYADY